MGGQKMTKQGTQSTNYQLSHDREHQTTNILNISQITWYFNKTIMSIFFILPVSLLCILFEQNVVIKMSCAAERGRDDKLGRRSETKLHG